DCGDFEGAGPEFSFLVNGSGIDGLSATCTASSETIDIEPGVDFNLTEHLDLPDGWSFVGADCNVDVDEIDGGVELNVDASSSLTCTFTNVFVGEVSVTNVLLIKDCGDFVGTGPQFTFLVNGSPIEGLTATCTAGSETID